jgi:hypothetical protein
VAKRTKGMQDFKTDLRGIFMIHLSSS